MSPHSQSSKNETGSGKVHSEVRRRNALRPELAARVGSLGNHIEPLLDPVFLALPWILFLIARLTSHRTLRGFAPDFVSNRAAAEVGRPVIESSIRTRLDTLRCSSALEDSSICIITA
jgi:hypothetical protein